MADKFNVLILLNDEFGLADAGVQALFEKLAKLCLKRHFAKMREGGLEGMSAAAKNFAKVYKTFEVSVLLTGSDEIRELNKQFRGKDKPTNVLSFPALEEYRKQVFLLGDVVISVPIIKQEASEQGKGFTEHLAHMFAHSILHLMGYDHEEPHEMAAMEQMEDEILAEVEAEADLS